MRIAALYDIHGNLPALEAVLDDVRRAGVDEVIIGGDVLPGPFPVETLNALLELEFTLRFIHGNGERAVLMQLAGEEPTTVPEQFRDIIRWTAAQLSGDQAGRIAAWPTTLQVHVPELGDVLFCHATPRSDVEIFTRLTPADELHELFESTGVPLVVCGHTHMQFDRMIGKTRVVNAGSVGMPFGAPGAYWLLLGSSVEFRRTPYDLSRAAERIRETTYPRATDFAEQSVLHPPTEDTMLSVFSRSPVR